MASLMSDTCDGEYLKIYGVALPLKGEYQPFPEYKEAGYVCMPMSAFARLTPIPPASDNTLTILVVFALIAQLVVNVIAIRRPTRSRS
jgi:hypothetical protein